MSVFSKEIMMRYWNCLSLTVPSSNADLLAALCHQNGSCGLTTSDSGCDTIIEAYFPADVDVNFVFKDLERFKGIWGFDLKQTDNWQVDQEDWEYEWRRFFRPIWATKNIVVHPSWIPVQREGVLSIVIDPKMAFGTGGHESTQLCLCALDKFFHSGMNCLDLGTGSGILAIAATKRNAKKVVALDVDKNAIENAKHNFSLNDIDDSITNLCLGSIEKARGMVYDFVFANIQSSILIPILGELRRLLTNEGLIVFSGLLATEEVVFSGAVIKSDLKIVDVTKKNEWISIVAMRGE